MKVAATLTVNGIAYPVELDPGTSLLAAVRDVDRPDRLEGGLRRLRVRRLHDAARRQARELVLLPGAPGRGRARSRPSRASPRTTRSPRCRRAFLEQGGVQCGFCTPGMLISATALLAANPQPTEDEVRIGLSGNLCRCTGYDGIVKAVLAVARRLTGAARSGGCRRRSGETGLW